MLIQGIVKCKAVFIGQLNYLSSTQVTCQEKFRLPALISEFRNITNVSDYDRQ